MLFKTLLVICWCFAAWVSPVWAESLSDRIAQYPHWQSQPAVVSEFEEVNYPTWMAGTWHCSSTLIDLVAPLADQKITTPGFEGNRKYLNQPVVFDVKFGTSNLRASRKSPLSLGSIGLGRLNLRNLAQSDSERVVVDRVFNGLSIAKAYLGEGVVRSVQINPNTPREQLTTLQDGRELLSITTGHNSERPNATQFLTTEVFQQVFRGGASGTVNSPYLNQVETTTSYQLQTEPSELNPDQKSEEKGQEKPVIIADQYTAIYLSPQDPNYFSAGRTPVAIYRYKLRLLPA